MGEEDAAFRRAREERRSIRAAIHAGRPRGQPGVGEQRGWCVVTCATWRRPATASKQHDGCSAIVTLMRPSDGSDRSQNTPRGAYEAAPLTRRADPICPVRRRRSSVSPRGACASLEAWVNSPLARTTPVPRTRYASSMMYGIFPGLTTRPCVMIKMHDTHISWGKNVEYGGLRTRTRWVKARFLMSS